MGFHRKPNIYVNVVSLNVSQLERSLAFYEKIIGFQILEQTSERAVLGADGETPLLIIEQLNHSLPKATHAPGLYHFAILLPTRAHLGSFLRHVIEEKVQLGASDHLVSEALYLSDPDGNGIEVYADRPKSTWRSETGEIQMVTDPLQAESLLADAEEAWSELPADTIIGHIHLHVSDLEQSRKFYCDGLGFDVVFHLPQALFMSTGGYHHHIAVNTWQTSKTKSTKNQLGLQWFSILFPNEKARKQVIDNLHRLGFVVKEDGHHYSSEDPSGNSIQLHI